MLKKVFPDNRYDKLLRIENVKGHTNFSYMGESDGIEIKCIIIFQTLKENILMHPDWKQENKSAEKLKKKFPNGYYVFEEFEERKLYYHFILDYDINKDEFMIKHIKREEKDKSLYIEKVKKEYELKAIENFEKELLSSIMQRFLKKRKSD